MINKLPCLALNTKGSPQHCLKSIYPVRGSSIQSGLFEYLLSDTGERYTTVTYKVSCKNRHKILTLKLVRDHPHNTFGLKISNNSFAKQPKSIATALTL